MNLSEALAQLEPYLRDDPLSKVNLATERILAFGKFKGLTKVIELPIYDDGILTLPQDYETLLGVSLAGRSHRPRDQWFRFASNGAFNIDPSYYSIDLGDGYTTYRDWEGAEAALLQGSEPFTAEVAGLNGVVRVSDSIVIEPSAFEDSLPLATRITKFKKPRTMGSVYLSVGGVRVAEYFPEDTDISYRRYSIPNAKEGDVLLALCKRRYKPLAEPSDELPIQSIYSLRLALEALAYEDAGDLDKASNFWGLCRRSLDDALSEHRNASGRTLPIYVRAAAGKGLRAVR